MLGIKTLVDSFLRRLPGDPGLCACYERYTYEARRMDGAGIDALGRTLDETVIKQREYPDALYGPYAEGLQHISALACQMALLSKTEKDDAPRYARFAIRLLTLQCGAPDWVTQGKNERRFDADLTTGQLCQTSGILYEMLRDDMTGAERTHIASAIYRLGIRPVCDEWLAPDRHRHALDSMGHNWWLVITCGAGVAALALREELPECSERLRQVCYGVDRWFRYPGNTLQNKHGNFGEEGDFIEFLGYLTYGLCTYAVLETCYREIEGTDALFEESYLRPQADMYRQFIYYADGRVRLANFGDTPDILVKHQHVIYYLAARLGRGDLYAWQRRMSPGPNDFEDFLFYARAEDAVVTQPDVAPRFAVYPHSGYAVARSGFADDDRFFAMKTGESWNHNHLDAGSFLLCDKGHEIAVDSGYCGYSRPEYRGYYVTPAAHNVVLLDGEGEYGDTISSGTKFSGSFPAALDAEQSGVQYMLADCTGPYANLYSRFYRHVLMLQDWIVLIDDLYAYKGGNFTWQMHYSGDLTENNGVITLRRGDDCTAVYPLYPAEKQTRVHKGYRDHNHLSALGLNDPEHKKRVSGAPPEGNYVALTFPGTDRRCKIITAFARTGADARFSPRVNTADGAIEIILPGVDGRERILYNTRADGSFMHRNSWLAYGELYTDASIAYVRENADNQPRCFFIANGSLLQRRGEAVLGALVKFDAALDVSRREIVWNACMDFKLELSLGDERTTIPLHKGAGSRSLA